MNFEKYIGLPFKAKGRDESGVDCWGLVRLVYKNEYGILLPSFSEQYELDDTNRIADLFAQYKEGWDPVTTPSAGDVVLFKILGYETHIGVCVDKSKFLHVREGKDSVIESLTNLKWSKRVVGVFKYSDKNSAQLNTVPHPLRTERYTLPIVPGTKVTELVKNISEKYNIAVELKSRISVLLNGKVVPQELWSTTSIEHGDVVEYRAVPGNSSDFRMIALIAIAIAAPHIALSALGTVPGAYVATALGGTSVFLSVAQAAVLIAGSALVNAIAPIRPPTDPRDPGTAQRQEMISGGQNRGNPYGAIPVVLGKLRLAPPLGSNNYLSFEGDRDSYISMLLVWGYGPLQIDASTLRIGGVPLTNYPKHEIVTLDRIVEPSAIQLEQFNGIYGQDYSPAINAGPLVCEGNPENVTKTYTGGVTVIANETESSTTYSYEIGKVFEEGVVGQPIEITVTSTTSSWSLSTYLVSNVVQTVISPTQRRITGTIQSTNKNNKPYIRYYLSEGAGGSYIAKLFTTLEPGPWANASTNVETDVATGEPVPVAQARIDLHFPQGLRYIVSKGDGAGESAKVAVDFEVESSTDDGVTYQPLDKFAIGGDAVKKDAFTTTKTYNFSDTTKLAIRIRRLTGDNTEDNNSRRYYTASTLQNITFVRNNRPAVDPVGAKIAKTAFKIQASDQLNGSLEGVSAIVQTWCKTWNGTTWVDGASSNPAALMRYVLEHPANPRRVTDASTQINLVQLQYFYEYCATKGFEYNNVLSSQRSILEVLRDICAAGRASPALVDGKWSVVIDEPRSNVVQMFTPHNSWGFEGTKALPKRPDGLRVTYYDQDQDYQEAEIIVYDVDKGSHNATLFESITLPGVTKKSLVIDHARWHMAQIKLRPEIYTINTDLEYLVCNRGDRVKVVHHVPMWGLGSGRVRSRVSSTVLELDEQVPLKATSEYTMRFRSSTGTTTTRNIVPVTQDGYYSTVELTSSITSTDADAGDLFLFGELNSEAQDLVVLAIEPTTNKGARITLVDYGVTQDYNIYTDYLTLTADVVFESQLTKPQILQIDSFGEKKPTITGFVSDESVMEYVAKGIFKYNINVAYVNDTNLPTNTEFVQVEYDLSTAESVIGARLLTVPFQKGSANLSDVVEGETYRIRLRYVGKTGRTGEWTEYVNHTVVGKINAPDSVTGFTAQADKSSGQVLLSWNENLEVDTYTYEVRAVDEAWGFPDNNRLFFGDSLNAFVTYPGSQPQTYYIRAVDSSGNYSLQSASVVFTTEPVANITSVTHSYYDTSLTNATITLNWSEALNQQFDIAYYEISYDNGGLVSSQAKATSIILPADWVGNRAFTIKTVDILGNVSSGYVANIPKFAPNPVTDYRAQVIDNNVLLYWVNGTKTSLPVAHVLLKRSGLDGTWETATVIGTKSGEFTSISELSGGEYIYWLAAVDTDGRESTPVEIPATVSQPPDFKFTAEFISEFTGTYSNATLYEGEIFLPVNTSETWEQHFVSRTWSGPQAQVAAGYPVFIQPGTSSGYYEEVFDAGTILSSSQITLETIETSIVGTSKSVASIFVSSDNVTYIPAGGRNAFATNFRYIKVRLDVTQTTVGAIRKIVDLRIRLDSKQRTEANYTTVSVSGQIVNFETEFIDVQSIILTPAGLTPVISVYDFKDSVITGTYTVSSNVATITANSHGLQAGQKVRLYFTSGNGISGLYVIASVINANSYTVSMVVGNTSGNVNHYPNSMVIYSFTPDTGAPVASTTSYQIKGY
jgi:sulfur carrier protein ThiS